MNTKQGWRRLGFQILQPLPRCVPRMNRTDDILDASGTVNSDEFDVFLPVSFLFFGFLQTMWILDDFQFLYWFGYVLVFAIFLFISVLIRRAILLKDLYEELSWQNGKTWTNRTASRNALYSVHIIVSALFMTVARFDWVHDNRILAVLFIGFSAASLNCALATLFPHSLFQRATRFVTSQSISVFVWMVLVGAVTAIHFHDIQRFIENQSY